MAHVDSNYKLMYQGIKTVTTIYEAAMHGKLSTDINLIHNTNKSFKKFRNEARIHGYKVPARAFAHLFQMPVSFYFNKDDQSINLLIHIPLLRDDKLLTMYKYIGTTIPITNDHGLVLQNKDDVIAYNDERYVTFKSADLWQCPKIAKVYFCPDIISSVKPINKMKNTCFGALKEAKFDQLLEKCDDIRIKTLKNEVKRITKSTWVLFSKEQSTFQADCLSKKSKDVLLKREIPFKGFMKISLNQNCIGTFHGERLWPETSFNSSKNVASYWLPQKNDFLEKYPNIDHEKIGNFLESLPNKTESQPLGDLLKYIENIDENNKMALQLEAQASQLEAQQTHNFILYVIATSGWMIILSFVIFFCVSKYYKTSATDLRPTN